MSLRFTEDEYKNLIARQTKPVRVPTLEECGAKHGLKAAKPSKYRNKPVTIDGIRFDSKREGDRYQKLKMLENAGKIHFLALQPSFILAPACTIAGKKKQPLRYVADFQYRENGTIVVEDCKGMLTDVYKIKRHLMKTVHGIDILET